MRTGDVLQACLNAAVVVAVGVFFLGYRRTDPTPRLTSNATGAEELALEAEEWKRLSEVGSILGDANAVAAVEFVDYECEYCAQIQRQVSRFVSRGQGAIAIRHYPLPQHPAAEGAARAAICAEEQGQFPAMHEYLFDNREWRQTQNWIGAAENARIGNLTRFERCLTSSVTSDRIRTDMELADENDVRATPTFITRDRKYVGVFSPSRWTKPVN